MLSSQLTDMFVNFHRVHEQLVGAIDNRLTADCGLTLGRVEVLEVIARLETCRVNDIADEIGITWGGASKIVDRLEGTRLCHRRPNPEDGRSSLIQLTATGRRALTKAVKVMTDELDEQVGGVLSAAALGQLAVSCRTMRLSARARGQEDRSA